MHAHIESLLQAYLNELKGEAETVAALMNYVSRSSQERRVLMGELQRFFSSEMFQEVSRAPVEQQVNPQDRANALMSELEQAIGNVQRGHPAGVRQLNGNGATH